MQKRRLIRRRPALFIIGEICKPGSVRQKPWLPSISNLHCCKSPATRRYTCRAGMDSDWSRSAYGVASNRVYICTQLPVVPVSSYLAFPSLPQAAAVYFCCTFPEVTLGGRYPLSCPVKPGLSSR